jgi:hypothetical protein
MKMNVLYDESHIKTDVYSYKINGGGEFFIKESGEVKILFENDVFVSASFPFRDVYTRNGWRILAGINEKIAEIEKRKKLKVRT